MLVEDVTSVLPQTCKCESDAEHSAQITDVCCTLSGHIGGIVDEYRSPFERLSIIINKIEHKQPPLHINGICQHEGSVIELCCSPLFSLLMPCQILIPSLVSI